MPDVMCTRDGSPCMVLDYLKMMIAKEIEGLEEKIEHEREMRVAGERQQAEALRIQAPEYERRLEALNHEHARVAAAQALFISRESFDMARKEEAAWRKDLHDRIERTADALPAYITRETWEASEQADRVWKNAVSETLAHNKGASERSMAFITVGLAVLAIALKFIP